MKKVTVHKARTHLSQLIADAEAGEDVVIMRGSEPAVRLVPVNETVARRCFGALAGELRDPFGRMLMAQAREEKRALVSNEAVFDAFGVTRLW